MNQHQMPVAHRLWKTLAIATVMALSCGCQRDDVDCTAVACPDGSTVDVRFGESRTEFLAVAVTVDGTTIRCTAPTLMHSGGCSSADVEVTPETQYTCTSDATNEDSCEIDGPYAQTIFIKGHAKQFSIELTSLQGKSWNRTFQPNYEERFPNGPECGAACRNAELLWEVN